MVFNRLKGQSRQGPAKAGVQWLAHEDVGKILVVESHINELPIELADQTGVELTGLDEGLEKADIVVLLVDHQVFRDIPPRHMQTRPSSIPGGDGAAREHNSPSAILLIRILICLDSNHTHEYVLAELEDYAPLGTRQQPKDGRLGISENAP